MGKDNPRRFRELDEEGGAGGGCSFSGPLAARGSARRPPQSGATHREESGCDGVEHSATPRLAASFPGRCRRSAARGGRRDLGARSSHVLPGFLIKNKVGRGHQIPRTLQRDWEAERTHPEGDLWQGQEQGCLCWGEPAPPWPGPLQQHRVQTAWGNPAPPPQGPARSLSLLRASQTRRPTLTEMLGWTRLL